MNDQLVQALKRLRLSGLLESLEVRLHEAASHHLNHAEFLELIVQDELVVRSDRLLKRRVKAAGFRELKTLDDFDWSFNPSLKKKQVFDLATARFIREHRDVLWLGPPGVGKASQGDTPLGEEVCEGQITVIDPRHPLFRRMLKLVSFAYLPGHIRHCQVELGPGQFTFVPVVSTDLATTPLPPPTLLTATAIVELVTAFQAMDIARRARHAKRDRSQRLGTTARQRTARLSPRQSWRILTEEVDNEWLGKDPSDTSGTPGGCLHSSVRSQAGAKES